MEKGSVAEELITTRRISFPPGGNSYEKAIEQLKLRYGREELLIQVYVRDLLSLVLQKQNMPKKSLRNLYDLLETKLRTLEILGVTRDKYAAMLFPLVESALPEETLLAWERYRSINCRSHDEENQNSKTTTKTDLDSILEFLQDEVQAEERIILASQNSGFDTKPNFKSFKEKKAANNKHKYGDTRQIASEADLLTSSKEQRQYPDNADSLSIHVFCDASKTAYVTCIYLRSACKNLTSCQLVQARSKVAPLKAITISRLELFACSIGTRLVQRVIEDLKLGNIPIFFWTDSNNALCWIKGSENWTPFVYNRIREIRLASKPENWHYVSGSINPADLPSRGCSVQQLSETEWWHGPPWLYYPSDKWSRSEFSVNEEVLKEKRKEIVSSMVNLKKTDNSFIYKFSNYHKTKLLVLLQQMLFPLFEPCSNAEILRAWQRNDRRLMADKKAEEEESRLESLMKFLKNEAENEIKRMWKAYL
ncbi:hypothetical protein HNY73_015597 [Argiope bruennichi]|uniref:Uncharacterized protein n=1 Tax=Argiope bruennichi TaxID=94029 RepID=A0A8T0ESL7_ARGBR|nr:hypothetical protein HNY73_015597 [Argiope bruennichi]